MAHATRIVGIVQARMNSSRLPGKVLKEVMGKPLLEYELERLRRIDGLDELVVATTCDKDDDAIVRFCEVRGIRVFRGATEDVLSRYYDAAKAYEADIVVRFTADCPLIDPDFAASMIEEFVGSADRLDYLGVDYERIPRGIDVEVFSFSALARAYNEGATKLDREHVTWYIHSNPGLFRVKRRTLSQNYGEYRLTVDTEEDFLLIESVLRSLYPVNPHFAFHNVIALLQKSPELFKLNSNIRQKRYVLEDEANV